MRRIIFLIAIFLLTLSPLMGKNPPVALPEDGNWPTIVGDSIMLIGPKQEALTEEQRYFNPPYLMVYPGKEHLKEQMIRAALCDCDPTKPNRRIGVFSVAPDKQVSFSQGNLQYLPAANIWKFADTQYEYLGNANKYLTPTFRNWVDLFGWSANNTTAPFGVSTSTNAADYAGDFVDWGTNTICGDAPNTWRTLSIEEWKYLYHERKNADKLFALGTINGVAGMILLPDDWQLPEGATCQLPTEKGLLWDDNYNGGGYINTNTKANHYQDNVYTLEQWQVMEEVGAVFLPAAGYRENINFSNKSVNPPSDHVGSYATNTISDQNNYYFMRFIHREVRKYAHSLYRGRSVRLVHDTIVPIPEYVDLGLSVKWATFNVGASKPEDYGDYFAWGETEPKETYSWATYKWGTSSNLTKYNTTDGKTILDPEDDAAQVHWGDKWRMPSKEEVDELTQQCSWIWTTHNNVNGYKVTGPNGNSIFLPAAGYKGAGPTYPAGEDGLYWTNTTEQKNYSYLIVLHDDAPPTHAGTHGTRCFGFAIRPVYDDIPDPCLVVKVNDTLSINMMCVEGGTFTMGDNNTSIASPAHQVTLSDYYIGETEVTQALWKSVMGNIPTGNKNPSYPVGYVTYADCQNFISKLNNLTGLHFQLPTEAEWEYAAMGGNKSHGYLYSGSNTIDDVAWYDQNSENKMHNVGAKQPNELGIYDMSGNAWEWCADYYDKYTADPKNDPKGPTTGTGRVIRSGSFRTTAERCSNKHRQAREADYPDSHITFRLVLHDTTPEPPKRIGVFSVGADKQVSFSQGNLQYIQSTDTWQFAANQLEYMGYKHYRNGQLADTIEYFGWSGKNSKAPWGISLSTESSDYEGEFLDWGTNTIAGDAPNTWRTLSNDEWLYICQGRKNADQLLGLGTIGTVTGLIILPDDWQLPAGLSFTPNTDNATKNQYTYNQWAELENSGAVFIATSGYFNPKLGGMRHVGEEGHIRTNALSDNGLQVYSVVKTNKIIYSYSGTQKQNLQYAFAQRLVHDTIGPTPELEYVDLGLSVKWATFNVGATSPNEIGNFYAWGEIEPKDTYTVNNYQWWNKSSKETTKYCTIDSLAYGDVADGLTELQPQDDIAHILKGEHWRMPNLDECKELVNGCTWTVSTRQGQIGFEGTSKINGNTIFLPVAGFRAGANLVYETLGGYWSSTLNIEKQSCAMGLYLNQETPAVNIYYNSSRQNGFLIRPVYDDRPTLTVIPTPEDAKVSFLCKGYQAVGHSITVDKGQNVLYQVTNVDSGYLSQGDSIYNLTKDTTLYVTLRPFSDGNWVKVDKSEYTKQEGYYVSRNNGGFASHSVWNYYVLPVLPGETYRVRGIAGQHAALWMAASTAPNPATNTRPTKISCCANRGVAAYVADEVTIQDGAKYLIINSRNGKEMMVERKVPEPCLVVKVNDTLSIKMMCVEGGTFRMGAMENDEKAKDDEKPAHKVTLTYDYHIMQTEVTQGLWEAVMGEDIYVAQTKMVNAPKPAYVGGDYPMYYVRMNDALEFIDKLNAMTGMHFRLPTEAEWEYAARGGNKSKGYLYAGSNNADDVGWYIGRGGLHRVAQLKPNELGIYDMSGNVGEMCLDHGTYGETYKAGDVVNPRGNIRSNGNRFWRGGCYTHSKDSMRVSQRSSYTPSWGGTWLGLRLVLAEDNDFRTIRVGNSYFDMSFVKGGTFMMGSAAPDAEKDEQPVHAVTLSDYYIGQTEVTQHLWQAVMGSGNNPSATKGNNLPVTNITWNEAQTFVERLSELMGMRFRLPTEAEWEYAARGGRKSKGYTYAGSNDIDEVGWYNGNSSNKTHAVGQKQPNELGIYDMTGNVYEFCQDWYGPYSAELQTNPQGSASSSKNHRVCRGGAFVNPSNIPLYCRVTCRGVAWDDNRYAHGGLRIVLEPHRYYRYGFTQEDWDAATSSWGHQGRGHAPADQSCIQGTMVHGIRLKVARAGSLNVYKVPSLLEKNEDHFELVATLTTDSTGLQDFDFVEPIYLAPNEYLSFGKPSEEEPTLRPCWLSGNANGLPAKAKGVAHYIGTGKAEVAAPNGSLMVEFY